MAQRFTREAVRNILGEANTDEIENALIALHIGVVDQIKDERDKYKAEADKLEAAQKELDALKADDFKSLYEKEHKDYEDYKAKIAREADAAKVRAEYRKLLTECNVSEKRLDAILKVTDFSNMKLEKDGGLKDAEDLKKAIKADWAEFVTETHTQGVPVQNPPQVNSGGKTRQEILTIKDTAERQKAIAENHQLFGF